MIFAIIISWSLLFYYIKKSFFTPTEIETTIPKSLLKILKEESTPVKKGTASYFQAIEGIKDKLNDGKQVLTLINKEPVLISRDSENNIQIKKV